mmetsp:Transcript_50544/g.161762  ORF Transcript_50544/g.161762 Transcript_50544/m.161762 type:complete len:222 (-) Transcript_50544:17-682(-)
MDRPSAKVCSPSSILWTWDTFGRFRFSSWISARYFFSSFSVIVSVQSLNSMVAMRSSISVSLEYPMDFFILLSWVRISRPSSLLSPTALLISSFRAWSSFIFALSSSSWDRISAFCAKNSVLPLERSLIFSVSLDCSLLSFSISSLTLATFSLRASLSGGGTRSCSSFSPCCFFFLGSALALALALGSGVTAAAAALGAMVAGDESVRWARGPGFSVLPSH